MSKQWGSTKAFACDEPGCGKEFESAAALRMHRTMGHKPEGEAQPKAEPKAKSGFALEAQVLKVLVPAFARSGFEHLTPAQQKRVMAYVQSLAGAEE